MLLRTTLALLLLATCRIQAQQRIEPCSSLVIEQTRAALAALRASSIVHGGDRPITLVYEGSAAFEDHLMRPGMVRTLPVRIEFSFDPGSGSFSTLETAGNPASPRTTSLKFHGARVAVASSPEGVFKEQPAAEALITRSESMCWLPQTSLHAALGAAATCRPGQAVVVPDQAAGPRVYKPTTYTDAAGRTLTLLLDAEHRVTRIERLWSHQRLGDVCEWSEFAQYQHQSGAAVPGIIRRFCVAPARTVRYELTLVNASALPPATAVHALPAERAGDIPDWGIDTPPAIEFVQLAPSLWSAELSEADARVLVIEREKDLLVLGAPDGDLACGQLVRALSVRFPERPIGAVAFGHHHPSPSGGLRALAAAGAVIIAPAQLKEHVLELLARPTTLGPPALPAPEAPVIQAFDGETTLECGALTVRLIDIGELSAHTFCYTVFYFPESGILFEDDLGYFPENGAAKVTPRLVGLSRALAQRNIVPRRLVQLWPVRGVMREVPWSQVEELVRSANTPQPKP